MLKCENVDKVFKEGGGFVRAVSGASLTVAEGERIYIHGPSGAGKSTLLHILGGLSRPTAGKVIVEERDLYRMGDRRRSMLRNRKFGFIFQFYHLLPELTVIENVMMPGMIGSRETRSRIRRKAEALLEAVGMTSRLRHVPGKLSGGEVQRCAIARALINEPEVLFCDEPTGNLDSGMSEEIYGVIRKLSQLRKMSVVLVSHQEVARDFFDTEYFMKDGHLYGAGVSRDEIMSAGGFEGHQAKGRTWG